MRSSQEIEDEYEQLDRSAIDQKTDKAYQEAIKRAKLDEQAQEQRDFEAKVDQILNSTPDTSQ